MSKQIVDFEAEEFTYSMIFESNDLNNSHALYMTGKSVCPKILISNHVLEFETCTIGKSKELSFTIINLHEELPINISFEKIPHFEITPHNKKLKTFEKYLFKINFQPFHLGKYCETLNIYLEDKSFNIPIDIIAYCENNKHKRNKSLDNFSLNNNKNFNFLTKNEFFNKETLVGGNVNNNNTFKSEKYDEFLLSSYNKKKFNEYLKSQRVIR